MRGVTAIAVLCTGCHYVLGLQEHFDAPPNKPQADAPPDAYFACEAYKPQPTTNDTDGDSITDNLDNCPNVANDQQDTDLDNVGDACDPRITNPADCIVMFFDFRSDPRSVWTEIGGNWQWSPTTTLEQNTSSVALAYLDMPIMQPSISVVASGVGGNKSEVGAYLITGDVTDAKPIGVTCTFQPMTMRLAVADSRETPPYSSSQGLGGSAQPVIIFAWAESDLPVADCGLQPMDAGRNTEGTRTSMRVPARVGFFTDNSIGRFHSVTIYGAK